VERLSNSGQAIGRYVFKELPIRPQARAVPSVCEVSNPVQIGLSDHVRHFHPNPFDFNELRNLTGKLAPIWH
jgi:hypothetical protein